MHIYITTLDATVEESKEAIRAGVQIEPADLVYGIPFVVIRDGIVYRVLGEAFGDFQTKMVRVAMNPGGEDVDPLLWATALRAGLELQEAGWLDHTAILARWSTPDWSAYPPAPQVVQA